METSPGPEATNSQLYVTEQVARAHQPLTKSPHPFGLLFCVRKAHRPKCPNLPSRGETPAERSAINPLRMPSWWPTYDTSDASSCRHSAHYDSDGRTGVLFLDFGRNTHLQKGQRVSQEDRALTR